MIKRDFIKILAERFPDLPEETVVRMSNKILDNIVNQLKSGGRAEIRGFGTFYYSTRRPRLLKLNNPHAKTVMELPERRIPRFKAGKTLSEAADDRKADVR